MKSANQTGHCQRERVTGLGNQDRGRRKARHRRRASRTSRVSLREDGTTSPSISVQDRNTNNTQAQEKAKPDASAIYVPGDQTAKAIEEAIEAEIPLVVAVAEHVPIHDLLRVGILRGDWI